MSDTNGVVAPNAGGTPDPVLPDEAIDGAIEHAEQNPVDTARLKAEQDNAELRHRLRAQEERIADLVRTSTQQSEMLSELVGSQRDARERGWQYRVDHLRGVMRKANNEADQPAYDAAERELFELMARPPTADASRQQQAPTNAQNPANPPNPQQAPPDPAVAQWLSDNPWFHSDKKLHRAAVAIEASVLEEKPYLSTADRLKEVRAEMAQRFPEKFGNPARNSPPSVSRPGPQAAAKPKPKSKTVADLPADAKLALDRIKRRDATFTDDDYLKSYKWDN